MDPQRYGSSPMLMERGSHPDLYGECNRCRHEMMGCCGYHVAPPCCYYGERGYHWTSYQKVFRRSGVLINLLVSRTNSVFLIYQRMRSGAKGKM
jgi:hypothetical protein